MTRKLSEIDIDIARLIAQRRAREQLGFSYYDVNKHGGRVISGKALTDAQRKRISRQRKKEQQ